MWRWLVLAFLPLPVMAHDAPHIRVWLENGSEPVVDGNVDITTPFAIASVGKIFTSIAMLRLSEKGLLDLDAPVREWLPPSVKNGFGDLADISLADLATMTSGLPDYYDDAYIAAAQSIDRADLDPAFAVRFAYDAPRTGLPGDVFDYSNTNYVLIQMALEAASNLTYAQILETEVFAPASLKDSFVFGTRTLPETFLSGHEDGDHIRGYYEGPGFGDGGVISSARDLIALYTALHQGTLLNATSTQRMFFDPLNAGYGMGIVISDTLVGHTGGDLGFSANIVMNWETGDIAIELVGEGDANVEWPDYQFD